LLYTHPVDISKSIPAIDANLRALFPLRIESAGGGVGIQYSNEEKRRMKQWARNELSLDINKLTVAIHPGSLFETKQWFPERFAALADRLQEKGYQVVITGSKEESATIKSVMEAVRVETRCLSPISLREFALFLSTVDVAIVNDGGVLHLAQAVNTRTCAIFGSTDPHIWFPYNVPEAGDYVYASLDCSPCALKRCASLKCMKDITVNEVFEKAMAVIKLPAGGR
jgi:ADP-heptose:LPS heptosyltransferase